MNRTTEAALAANLFRRWVVSSDEGMAAIEFAAIMPFLLIVLFGSFEVTQGILLQRQVALTADTVTNVVGQYTTISASTQMPDILGASAQIFAPNSASAATIVVSLITIDGTGKATVTWSQALNGAAHAAGQVMAIPAGLDIKNTSLVLGEVTYAYVPVPLDFIQIGTVPLSASVFMSTRDSSTISLVS